MLFLMSSNHMGLLPAEQKKQLKTLDAYQLQAGVYTNKEGQKRHIAMVIVPYGAIYYATVTGKRQTMPDGKVEEAYESPNSRGLACVISYMALDGKGNPGTMASCKPSEFADWLKLEAIPGEAFPFEVLKKHGPGYRETLSPPDREAALKISRNIKSEDIMKDVKAQQAAEEAERKAAQGGAA